MQLSITGNVFKPLLSRSEIRGTVSFESRTPSNDELRKALSAGLKADEGLVSVKGIFTRFGGLVADFSAFLYKDRESMARFEPKKKEKKVEQKPAGAN